MTKLDDAQLLAEYARNESEAAFAVLVTRYMNLVYSTALRFTGNAHHAEEITQAVFIILARKTTTLRCGVVLSGWLYQATRLTAANFVKGEIRRQNREQEAYMQSTGTEPAAAWEQIAPLLDEAMGQLSETDRNAIVLRFFEHKTTSEIATTLKLNEAAAHKRVARGLEKLRKYFVKRGVTLTVAAIAGTVAANSVSAAPIGLAVTTAAAVAKGAALSGSTLAIVKGTLKIMAWTKIKTATIAGAIVLLTAGTMIVIKETHSRASERTTVISAAYPGDWIWNFNSDTLERVPPLLIFRPTQLPTWVPSQMFGKNRYLATGRTVKELITSVWSQKNSAAKLVFLAPLPDDKFDCIVTLQNTNWWDALESEINRRFDLITRYEYHDDTGSTVTVEKAK